MNKLGIKLENCFGIKSFDHEFLFNIHKRDETNSALIYASNGTMKTSFAKTLRLISKKDPNDLPKDQAYPDKRSTYEILCDGETLSPDRIFVIDGEDIGFDASEKISDFLASNTLKSQYDEILNELERAKSNFLKELKKISRSSDCETEILDTFKAESIYDIFIKINHKLKSEKIQVFSFGYHDVFDKKGKVQDFVKHNSELLLKYVEQYNLLLEKSTFFKASENSFGTYQAKQLIKSINDDAFFDAGHTLLLENGTRVESVSDLEEIVKKEMDKILDDIILKKEFEKIDKVLDGNSELRLLRSVLEKDKLIISKLLNYDDFRKEVWIGFFQELSEEVNSIATIFANKKEKIRQIINEANKEKGLWEKIIKTFNNRFHVPFKVKLTNQSDVLLKQKVAKLEFIFNNNDLSESPTSKHKDEIIKILSKGEQRAFHILQILFEIESRIGSEKNHLLVFDDIADSFDYKNKYAIIEYIKDLDREGTFKQIILTHNFDFFRTVSRRILSRKNSFIAVRDNGIISLFNVNTKGCDIRDSPFLIWKKNLTNQVYLIATIPFVRNLIEYKTGDKDNNYMSLTSLLHIKKDTFKINFRDIERIFNEVIGNVNLPCDLLGQNIFDIIIPTCKKLCSRGCISRFRKELII